MFKLLEMDQPFLKVVTEDEWLVDEEATVTELPVVMWKSNKKVHLRWTCHDSWLFFKIMFIYNITFSDNIVKLQKGKTLNS